MQVGLLSGYEVALSLGRSRVSTTAMRYKSLYDNFRKLSKCYELEVSLT
jgi:hypothetical protein